MLFHGTGGIGIVEVILSDIGGQNLKIWLLPALCVSDYYTRPFGEAK